MTETYLGIIPFFGLLLVSIGAVFYMLGGRSGKWKRRFIGSLLVSSGVWVEALLLHKFSFYLLLIYPLCIGSFVLGYGSDIVCTKIIKRSIIVLASLISGLLLSVLFSGFSILLIEIIIASVSIYLGVRNPIPAAAEEFFICICLWLPKLMYPFI